LPSASGCSRAHVVCPDAVVPNGDHIYWDLKSERANLLGASPSQTFAGEFDPRQPVLGTPNEQVLKKPSGRRSPSSTAR
jgi:hypothetical protein